MSFWNDIGDDFKKAFDGAKTIGEKVALSMANGANVFASGWKDVFSGNFQQGLKNISAGILLTLGVPPEPPVQGSQIDDALGSAALWSLQQYQQTNTAQCYSEYENKVRQNLAGLGVGWTQDIADKTRDGAQNYAWINMGC